ncbi:MAG: DUF1223 domain-containing protein [Emcibacter sp.]|nr:DUF1223 domain-containing protein [Emcibacter sp.]
MGLAQARQNLVVVELFTSQGCNSCPPADDILAELREQENILALGYSVDYWNYLGWKDTLARPDCVVRQRKYNKTLGKSGVYTPQMVVQGEHDVIGSRRGLIQDIMKQVRAKAENSPNKSPEITFHRSGDMIDLRIGAYKSDAPATIWIIGYDYERTVAIKSGELGGQVRKYHNVVQMIRRVGSWTGQEIKLTLSKADLDDGQSDAYALLLQTEEAGPIIAAAKLQN